MRIEDSELLGQKVGHIRIVDVIGEGGMGAVYAGFDDTLQRRVAVKAIRKQFRLDPDAKARFLREARILSQLQEPHICTVHDFVEGADADFLVMELVEGRSLRAALSDGIDLAQSLSIARQLLEVLVVVHERGVVHRDLKPENVMVQGSGDIKVLDFGLARSAATDETMPIVPTMVATDLPVDEATTAVLMPAEKATVPAAETEADTRQAGERSTLRTRAGSIIGTAGYMSPGQARGEPVTAPSDMYSFGLMLQEMLTGRLPYERAPDQVLLQRAAVGESLSPTGLQANLVSLIERLKALEAAERPTAAEALDELEWIMARPARRRRRMRLWGASALFIVAVCSTIYGLWQHRTRQARLCSGGSKRIAETWNQNRRQSLHASFTASGAPFADAAWSGMSNILDAYLERWIDVYTEACESTRIRGERSENLLDRQMVCLEQRLREVDALLVLLAQADLDMVARAHEAVQGLRSVEICADTIGLTAEMPLPDDPLRRQRITELGEALAEAEALEMVGGIDESHEMLSSLAVDGADADHAPLLAEILIAKGSMECAHGDTVTATTTLRLASVQAERAGSDRLAAHVAEQWCWLHAEQADLELARWWCEIGTAKLDRIGPAPELEVDLLTAMGSVQKLAGEYDAALVTQKKAFDIAMRVFGEESRRGARAHNQLATALSSLGRYEDALPHFLRNVEIDERVFGPGHPELAMGFNNLGFVYYALRRFDEAIEKLEQALAIEEATLGTQHPLHGTTLNNLASAYQETGRADEALAVYDRSLSVRRENLGVDHPDYAISLLNRCTILSDLDRVPEAIEDAREAAAILLAALGADHPYVGYALNAQGFLLYQGGRPAEAIPHLERALAIGSDDFVATGTRLYNLARALHAAGRDRERVQRLVAEARQTFTAAGDRGGADLEKLELWVRENLIP